MGIVLLSKVSKMKKPKYETGIIKCYPRPGKNGKIPGYQRRILLKSDGSLNGCPEDENPKTIIVLYQEDFQQIFDTIDILEKEKNAIKNQIDIYESTIQNLQHDKLQLKEENHQLNSDIRSAVAFIGMSYAGIQDLKSMTWIDRLRKKIPKSLQNLKKPPKKLLPLPEESSIEHNKNRYI